MSRTIGWIGTGVMGTPMCSHLMDLAENTIVYNRTKSKTEVLQKLGAEAVDTPKEVALRADIIFTIVGHPQDVREVYFGEEGIFKGSKEGQIVVDMTTTEPSLAKELYEKGAALGVSVIDAPVSGGDVGARNGTLSIMAGGEEQAFRKVLPYFEKMGTAVLQGKAGSGQHTKMCNQIVIAGTMAGVCESLLYGRKAGLDIEKLIGTITKGAAGCWTLDNLAPRIAREDYSPGFMISHFVKDMGIALEESETMGLQLPCLSMVDELYRGMIESEEGALGTQALIKALDRINGTHLFDS